MGKFCQKFFLIISANYCWRHYFLAKLILVKLKILYILMQWLKWSIFWNIFLYCKIAFSFLQLFLVNYFLYILQTQLLIWYFFYFEFIFLYVCKSWCITTLYYMYSHFLVHEDNKNTRKIKLLIGSVKYT